MIPDDNNSRWQIDCTMIVMFQGIAVLLISGFASEEVADTTFSFILNLYHQTFELTNALKDGQNFSRLDDGAKRSLRIRGECLGLIGLGKISISRLLNISGDYLLTNLVDLTRKM